MLFTSQVFSSRVRQIYCALSLSHVQLFATPWTVAPPHSSVYGIFQERILEQVLFPTPGDLPDSGIEPVSPAPPALTGRFVTTEPHGKPQANILGTFICSSHWSHS